MEVQHNNISIWTWNNSFAASTWWFALRYSSTALNVLFLSRSVLAYFTSSGSVSRTLWSRARSMAVFHWFSCTHMSIACCTFPHCSATQRPFHWHSVTRFSLQLSIKCWKLIQISHTQTGRQPPYWKSCFWLISTNYGPINAQFDEQKQNHTQTKVT